MVKKADIFILLAAVAVFSVFFFAARGEGRTAKIYSGGDFVAALDLNVDQSYTVTSEWGSNTVEIRGKRAFVTHADCPDRLCEKSGGVFEAGSSIVCLPNRLTVLISGKSDIDAVVK